MKKDFKKFRLLNDMIKLIPGKLYKIKPRKNSKVFLIIYDLLNEPPFLKENVDVIIYKSSLNIFLFLESKHYIKNLSKIYYKFLYNNRIAYIELNKVNAIIKQVNENDR